MAGMLLCWGCATGSQRGFWDVVRLYTFLHIHSYTYIVIYALLHIHSYIYILTYIYSCIYTHSSPVLSVGGTVQPAAGYIDQLWMVCVAFAVDVLYLECVGALVQKTYALCILRKPSFSSHS